MKLSNKIIIASSIACLFAVVLVVTAVFKSGGNLSQNNGDNTHQLPNEVGEVQNNISEPLKSTDSADKYMLRLEENEICAYMILEDGSLMLWNSVKAPPDLPSEDKASLEQGVTTDTFEKLCLYFESYAS